uniref:Essential MCU regulator, mitochondrial n=1 Tax=Ascaris lumbricoides TaxID=6252 RepID=A0A0M3I3M7_ASCLU
MNNLIGRVVALRSAYASLIAVQQRVLPIEKSISNVPYARPFGMTKLTFITVASLFIGGVMAKSGASFLEENEIFVPAEDDDD